MNSITERDLRSNRAWEERFDILSIGEGIDVEMYLESPAHLLTYKGEEMTDVVEQSSIREDLGKYDFMALMVAFFKTIVPVLCILLMYKTECTSFANVVLIGILLYDLGDTVVCLSEVYDSMLMWSHYAQNHRFGLTFILARR